MRWRQQRLLLFLLCSSNLSSFSPFTSLRHLQRSTGSTRRWRSLRSQRAVESANSDAASFGDVASIDTENSNAPLFETIEGEESLPHAAVREWVVFSDLHLSERSVDTCLAVLRKVHATALERDSHLQQQEQHVEQQRQLGAVDQPLLRPSSQCLAGRS